MTNYNHFRIINDLTGLATRLGFEINPSRGAFNSLGYEPSNGSDFALTVPKDDGDVLPIYTRGVTIYSGSAEDCIHFMHGWMQSREYMTKAIVDGKDPGVDWYEGKEYEDVPF